ncbi:N-glycosylase/DNA lyase [Candidatus Korarchaeum cryptofilum]|jgi:N-glycosylase/DNA lyase|uniref:8-oxoguanine DNA glycosylase/AP lyase n=2 Tax=Candidatus Korarchaeum cryptofilum TaxID=498846 RepID=OGG1_KORCO|nr:N-glycosylase/DNA lyase [Candidatus Korarchaeum cryptofilum]B1L640.1 RecName: Full=8-oxoguanine DNA glycosylase/AP lyase; Includes: RecName: Full=8-oxoguanine DNA glycosylase; Short=8-oxoG DNA glycosylase; Includes: RecName: Full=DNA-(apurinic or apyrimidinic site) lyase; Short=AP lyase [Candidatus Korarchaeum cryptofilum OPF8]ACB07919.1 DNA-(apurinic or apyrimidinic site) lyase [Candidatus Korarchaeum cryptofilum OPF8]RSN69730.1 N-glycosylase/DNA lyase [Candidatus Korarchaeum cryptofilum]
MGVDDLVNDVMRLKGSRVREIIERRMREFERERSDEELFKELVFCLLTANFSAEGGLRILESLGDGIFTLSEEELAAKLAELGHRYPRKRAEFIVEARKLIPILRDIISSFRDERLLREWLVKNVKGLGYKEASHFLRNIGFKNVSIIDYHILDLLMKYGILEEKPKSLSRARYLMIESILEEISRRTGINLGELDLYLWYIETGKVLK